MNSFVFDESASGDLRFVGDFEALYGAETDPWEQSGKGESRAYYAMQRHRLASALNIHCRGETAIEIGAGHGHATAALAQMTGRRVCGLDVSQAAVTTARALHPALVFVQGDIKDPCCRYVGQFGAVILNQVWWYLLDSLDIALRNCLSMTEPGGIIAISHAFLRDQRYGCDVADGFGGAIVAASARLPGAMLVHADFDAGTPFDDGLILFRKAPRC